MSEKEQKIEMEKEVHGMELDQQKQIGRYI